MGEKYGRSPGKAALDALIELYANDRPVVVSHEAAAKMALLSSTAVGSVNVFDSDGNPATLPPAPDEAGE